MRTTTTPETASHLDHRIEELQAFIFAASDDLRAPLLHIDGFAELVREDYRTTLDAGHRDCLDRIQASVREMHRLLQDLLNFSRLAAAHTAGLDPGKQPMQR